MSGKAEYRGSVLIVDGDPEVGQMISAYFEEHHLPVSCASNRSELDWRIAVADLSVIVLDLGLGGEGGFDLLRLVRSASTVPVIVTTDDYLNEIDRIVAFELGADDYLVKPFGARELLARIRAVLRRQELGRVVRVPRTERGDYRFGGWRLQRRNRQLVDPAGIRRLLSKAEFALLRVFLEQPQRLLCREDLLHAAQDDGVNENINTLIYRLRRKLEPDPNGPRMIETQRGIGYIFMLPVRSV
jgi:two-component system, OmpR family, response regulator